MINSVCSNCQPLRLISSGQGGTGKSKVIDILNRIVSREVHDAALPVVIAAPTGLAAFSIGGTTLHRLLNLPIEYGKPADYSRLQQEQLTLLKATLKGVRLLLIIDEVSMVSSLTQLYVHMRLTEITSCNDLFGGLNTVFFADFLQLPPVKGNQPFIPVTFLEAKQRFGAIASINVSQTFEYDELTINMRHHADNIRVSNLTDEQYHLLSGRLITPGGRATVPTICQKYHSLAAEGQSPLILMPRTSLCDEINTAMLTEIGTLVHILMAIDTLDTVVASPMMKKVQHAYEESGDDVT